MAGKVVLHRASSSGAVVANIIYEDGAWGMCAFPSKDECEAWAIKSGFDFELTPEMESYYLQLRDLQQANRRAVEG